MKKVLIATLAIGMMAGCEEPTTLTKPSDHVISLKGVGGTKLKVVEIEGCEYFVGSYDRSGLFTHKGNCKNPIHPKNKSHE